MLCNWGAHNVLGGTNGKDPFFLKFLLIVKVNSFYRSILSSPQCFCDPPVTNYMLLYSTLLCKKTARAPGGHKKFILTKLGGGDPFYNGNCLRGNCSEHF